MRISKIQLKGVGVFEDETIEFPQKQDPYKAEIHIFTGENGTGKSTLLYALSTINADNIIGNTENIALRLLNQESWVKVSKDNTNWFVYRRENGHLKFDYNLTLTSFELYNNDLGWEHTNFATAFFAYSGYRQLSQFTVNSLKELEISPLENALNFQKSINSEVFLQWLAITAAKEAVERNRQNIISANYYKTSTDRIAKVVSDITGQKIEFYLEVHPLVVKLLVDGKLLSFDVLPDGLKSIISWVGDLLMRMERMRLGSNYNSIFEASFILFLDEIEVHLHPAWQRKILPVVQSLFKNAQIFISTHSPFVVGPVDGAYVHKLVLKDGVSHANTPRLTKTGESLSLILDEVFGIDEEFDVETEKEFDVFYKLKEEILKGDVAHENDFINQARTLASKSEELKDIVGREIRQVNRLAKKDYAL